MKMFSRKKWRFTLIELLVVIAIISLLAAMLLPSLQKSKSAGKRIKCAGTLKQMSVCWASYCGDNGDWTVPAYWAPSPSAAYPAKFVGNDFYKSFWFGHMAVYAPQCFDRPPITAYACNPMCDEAWSEQGMTVLGGDTLDFKTWAYHGGYGYSQIFGYHSGGAAASFSRIRVTSLKTPGSTYVMLDAYVSSLYPSTDVWTSALARSFRHLNAGNILFSDGHVGTGKFPDPILNVAF